MLIIRHFTSIILIKILTNTNKGNTLRLLVFVTFILADGVKQKLQMNINEMDKKNERVDKYE